ANPPILFYRQAHQDELASEGIALPAIQVPDNSVSLSYSNQHTLDHARLFVIIMHTITNSLF
ncbi:MAG: hypothetical protein B7Y32_05550, partial [Methylophilales bacterium 16-45-7]